MNNYSNIKVISCDIDGTLCAIKQDPSISTIKALEDLRKKGIVIGLASGRPASDLFEKYKSWGLNDQFDFIIGYNGGELYDHKTNQISVFNQLKKEWLKEIIEFMAEFDPNIHMYKPGIYLSSRETERSWYSAWKNKRVFTVINDLSDFYNEDSSGIMFRCDLDKMPKIEEKLKTLKGKEYFGFKTQADMVEFAHVSSNKGFAFKKYLEMYHIDVNDAMAIGDTTNDNEMIKMCHGIVLKNGSDDTKALGELITEEPIENDGFSKFVNKYLL